ncbi:ErmE/ErmH/ErmO/ErmR family 23S rRNA (adenine(2058)-N(6))-methyltransferase [Streptosporangium sp. NPDC048047]|uniref:ErmE/ErmH/ErmO/ErmR family 23S rRNA (adenine(2058)-N(6))-methyltransferase n=1 Tax=Streptosporangium sp. NPDC048047 TaxID=3155748 RepID=UPI0034359E59
MARSFAHGNHSHTQKKVRADGGGRTTRDQARRALSQNFMADPREIDRVVAAAAPEPGDLVLEPGAGEGPLTRVLAGRCRKVIAYEIDPLLAGKLAARTRDDDRIEVVRGDFTAARPPAEPFAVVGNIPYAVTSRIVDWCLRAGNLTSATLVTQLEYARKRTGDYGRWSRLTVVSWPRHTWHLHGVIDRAAFRPVPGVDSAILRIRRRPAGLLPPEAMDAYRDLVELGFSGVGGTLRASLRRRHSAAEVDAALAGAGVDPDSVVAHVHPDRWIALFHRLH